MAKKGCSRAAFRRFAGFVRLLGGCLVYRALFRPPALRPFAIYFSSISISRRRSEADRARAAQ
jgi:hypothetical protein